MDILLIRHTAVDVNKGICYGQSNVKLASTYTREKQIVACEVMRQQVDEVYTSPLLRCSMLANDLFPKIPVVIDNRLLELNFGDWELKSWDSIFKSGQGKKWFADYVNTPCPNGESFKQQVQRINCLLQELKSKNKRNVALVTHAGIIRAIYCIVDKIEPQEAFNRRVEYGAVIKITL